MVLNSDFDVNVDLPAGLDIGAIRRAIEYIERRAKEFIELYEEQPNLFSGFIGVLGIKALDSVSKYEKHKHRFTAPTRFPDLCRRGARSPLAPRDCLESKGSSRAWAIQSHYDHAGWYIVWRYLVDPAESIEPNHPVIIWRVDGMFLEKTDWKYEGSTASEGGGGGRTHTFGVAKPSSRLRRTAVYRRKDIVVKGGKPVPANGNNSGSTA